MVPEALKNLIGPTRSSNLDYQSKLEMMGKHQDNYKKKAQGNLLINDTVLKTCLALLFFYMCPGAGNEAEYLQNCDCDSCIQLGCTQWFLAFSIWF